jgi:hypothetical protein
MLDIWAEIVQTVNVELTGAAAMNVDLDVMLLELAPEMPLIASMSLSCKSSPVVLPVLDHSIELRQALAAIMAQLQVDMQVPTAVPVSHRGSVVQLVLQHHGLVTEKTTMAALLDRLLHGLLDVVLVDLLLTITATVTSLVGILQFLRHLAVLLLGNKPLHPLLVDNLMAATDILDTLTQVLVIRLHPAWLVTILVLLGVLHHLHHHRAMLLHHRYVSCAKCGEALLTWHSLLAMFLLHLRECRSH